LDCKIHEKTNDNISGFLLACRENHFELAKFLLKLGSDVNETADSGETCLIWACDNKNMEAVKYFIDLGCDVNAKITHTDDTALTISCQNNAFEIAKYLVSEGSDVNQKNDMGDNGLLITAMNENLEFLKFFINLGCDVNEQTPDGMSPFSFSCQRGYVDMAKYLFTIPECDIDITNIDGITCFDFCINDLLFGGKTELPMLLLEYGCVVTERINEENADTCIVHERFSAQEIEDIKKVIFNFFNKADVFIIDLILDFTCGLKNLDKNRFLDIENTSDLISFRELSFDSDEEIMFVESTQSSQA
jgi:hypothetical protein